MEREIENGWTVVGYKSNRSVKKVVINREIEKSSKIVKVENIKEKEKANEATAVQCQATAVDDGGEENGLAPQGAVPAAYLAAVENIKEKEKANEATAVQCQATAVDDAGEENRLAPYLAIFAAYLVAVKNR